jgi:cytochrome c-type biogenesis protein CcmH/NrfG
VFDHLGEVYVKLNRLPEALEAWQRAAALDPKNKNLADKIENTRTRISKGNAG